MGKGECMAQVRKISTAQVYTFLHMERRKDFLNTPVTYILAESDIFLPVKSTHHSKEIHVMQDIAPELREELGDFHFLRKTDGR